MKFLDRFIKETPAKPDPLIDPEFLPEKNTEFKLTRRQATLLGILIFLFLFVYLFHSIVVTIYPGEAGVLFKRFWPRGTVLNKIYSEGIHVKFPWNKMYRYDARIQEIKQDVEVLSQNGLSIHVNMSVRFHLVYNDVARLHKAVGPDYIKKIVVPVTISSVREAVGNYLPEALYTTARHVIQDEILVEAVEENGRVPIIYDDMIVQSIRLPEVINAAIEAKLRQQQQFLEYEFRIQKEEQEAKRKEIEANGIRNYQSIIAQNLTDAFLRWKGIQATLELAQSPNAKIIVIGGKGGLPIILNPDGSVAEKAGAVPSAPVKKK